MKVCVGVSVHVLQAVQQRKRLFTPECRYRKPRSLDPSSSERMLGSSSSSPSRKDLLRPANRGAPPDRSSTHVSLDTCQPLAKGPAGVHPRRASHPRPRTPAASRHGLRTGRGHASVSCSRSPGAVRTGRRCFNTKLNVKAPGWASRAPETFCSSAWAWAQLTGPEPLL